MRRRYTIALATLTVVGVMAAALIGPAAAQPVVLTVSLTGGGAGQDPNGSGTATVTLDAAAGTACFDLDWTAIRGPFAAHIHEGGPGQEGAIVIPFFDMKDGTPLARTIKGVSGCNKQADASVIDAILADPAGFYVNVHNRPFPAGAIRAQLAASTPTTTSTTTPTMSPYP